MELLEVIRTRRSIRKYEDRPVPDKLITAVLEAAMYAPSAGNQQPWHFVVIRDRMKLDRIPSFHPYSHMILQAKVAILVCGDPAGGKWPTYWVQDCSAATQNILLAARDFGLGSVWAGVYPDEGRMAGFRELLAIPQSVFPFALIPLGWPMGEFARVQRFRPERIHQETWSGDIA